MHAAFVGAALGAGLVVSLGSAMASTLNYALILERDIDVQGQTDLFLITYASLDALKTNTGLTQTALPQQIASDFSLGGAFFDDGIHLVLERDTDLPGQTDLFLISYADLDALKANTGLTQTALPQPIASDFSVGGVFLAGGAHLLLERDADLPGQTDLFQISYDDLDAMKTNTGLTQTALPQPIASDFSVGGVFMDGGAHLLLERDTDLPGQTDLFLISYADLDALKTNTGLTQTALPQPIASDFSVRAAFAYSVPEPPPLVTAPIPLPASAWFLLAALGCIATLGRRWRIGPKS